MAYDFQVSRVYRFDERVMAHLGERDVPKPVIKLAVKQMCERFGLKRIPTVEFEGRRKITSTYYPASNKIRFPANPAHGHHHVAIVCHETAHAIVTQLDLAPGEPAHGPKFVRIYIQLLAEFGDKDILAYDDLVYEARKLGILVGPLV